MLTQRTAIKMVTNFAREVKSEGVNLKKVILYGSFARNKQHEWSDIDVALVADEFENFGFIDIKRFASVLVKEPYYIIQPKTYSSLYFNEGDAFIDEIKKTGIEIEV